MKLYQIIVLHGAPNDSHTSTETYLVAENEEQVFDWLAAKTYGAWTEEPEEGEEPKMRYSEASKSEITFRQWIMEHRGDLEDDEGWEDAYYGITKWGWQPIEATPDEIAVLLKLGIAVTIS